MKKWVIIIILVALLIVGVIGYALIKGGGSFKFSFSSAKITDAKSCRSVDEDKNPIGITSTFPPNSPEISIWFSWAHAPIDTNAKAVWIYETSGELITEYSLVLEDMAGLGSFSLIRPTTEAGWPIGDYRVYIYLNNKLAKSVSFKVQTESEPSYNWTTYIDPIFNFSFMHPEEGTREIRGNIVYIKGSKDEKGHTPNINIQVVVSAESGGAYENINEAATATLSQLSTAENYKLISDSQLITIDGQDARETTVSFSYDLWDIKQNNAYVQDPKAGTIYIIGYTATTLTYPEYLDVYEKVKETFRLSI